MDDGTRITEEVEKFLRAARSSDAAVCAEMLAANPRLINCVEAGGFCALHFSAFNGDIPLMKLLFRFHPDLQLTNYDGNTPMMMAAKGHQIESIKLLANAGADVNFQTSSGATAAHFAASMGYVDVVRCLISLGAKAVHDRFPAGSLLHWAAHSGDVACIAAMLYDFNIPVDIKDSHGGTALFTALFMKKGEVVQFLLEHGANPNTTIEGDLSAPLHIAVEHGNVDDVKILLAFGANTQATNSDGESPVALAEKGSKSAALRELLKPTPSKEKRLEDAARFKAHGNRVYQDGEWHKAAKFYSLAIQNEPLNHLYFSNRAACYFSQKYYLGAWADSCRCIVLSPGWAKGYFRKAATLHAMKESQKAVEVLEEGLKLDSKNDDLLTLREEITKSSK
jgi:ankyrin repeat protein